MFWLWLTLAITAQESATPLEKAAQLIESGFYAQAEPLLSAAQHEAGTEVEALTHLARIANFRGDYKNGIQFAKPTLEAAPGDRGIQRVYAVALRNKMAKAGAMAPWLTVFSRHPRPCLTLAG